MSDTEKLQWRYEHARSWIDAWNDHDLDAIMGFYAPGIRFNAQTVVDRWELADGWLEGLDQLREHFRRGLNLSPRLHFRLVGLSASPGGYLLNYERDSDTRVAEAVALDQTGLAELVLVFYAGPQD